MPSCKFVNIARHISGVSQHSDGNDIEINQSLWHYPINKQEHKKQLKLQPNQPSNPKSLKVAIIGSSNVGKSTLANSLMDRSFATVSSKVHTTRKQVTAVKTIENTQIILLDTPGMVSAGKKKRFKLEKSFLEDPYNCLLQADLISVVADVSYGWGRAALDKEVRKALHLFPSTPAILILNKVDKIKNKRKLLETVNVLTEGVVDGQRNRDLPTENYQMNILENTLIRRKRKTHQPFSTIETVENIPEEKDKFESTADKEDVDLSDLTACLQDAALKTRDRRGWDKFKRVFMTNALEHDGVEEIFDYMLSVAVDHPWTFHSSVVTDQNPEELITLTVWGKLMDKLPNEIPYNLKVKIVRIEDFEESLIVECTLHCLTKRYASLCMGSEGNNIKRIAIESELELSKIFQRSVTLRLNIKQ